MQRAIAAAPVPPAHEMAHYPHPALKLSPAIHLAILTLEAAAEWSPQPALPPQLLRAAPKRQSEYRAGRCCAALALTSAGQADADASAGIFPGMGADRLPLWPAGWTGSISHAGGYTVAAVAPLHAIALLGIDVERLIEPAAVESIAPLVAFDGELDALAVHCAQSDLSGGDAGHAFPAVHTAADAIAIAIALTLLFSAKEALYKALYPDVRRFIDFSGARLVDVAAQRLTLELTEDWHPAWRRGERFTINYNVRGQLVYCVCARAAQADDAP